MASAVEQFIAGQEARVQAMVDHEVERLAQNYIRHRDLPPILGNIDGMSSHDIIADLSSAYEAERNRTRTGHWSLVTSNRAKMLRGYLLAEKRMLLRAAA